MAGTEGWMKWTTKHPAMAAAGKASEAFSTKRRVEKSGGKRRAEKGGTSEKEKGGFSGRKAEKGTAADAVAAQEEVVEVQEAAFAVADLVDSVPEVKARMSEEYVYWILSQKRAELEEDPDDYYNRMINDPDRPEVYTQEFLEEERETMRMMASLYKHVGDRLEKLQNWLRVQISQKGYVEVDEAYLARRIRLRQYFTQEKRWNAIMSGQDMDEDDEDVDVSEYEWPEA